MKRLALVALLLLLPAPRAFSSPVNLVTNGDFSAGNVGFETDYDYVGHAPNAMWPDGVYTVDTSASVIHALWETSGDHDGGGNFMLVNGSTEVGQTVWAQTISTIVGWTYDFSLWAKNLCCTDGGLETGPQLAFLVNGIQFGAGTTDGPGVWQPFGGSFLATSHTARIEVRNGVTDYRANDFGLDDISVTNTATPEPTSLLMLATGCVLLVKRLRRAS